MYRIASEGSLSNQQPSALSQLHAAVLFPCLLPPWCSQFSLKRAMIVSPSSVHPFNNQAPKSSAFAWLEFARSWLEKCKESDWTAVLGDLTDNVVSGFCAVLSSSAACKSPVKVPMNMQVCSRHLSPVLLEASL